MLAYKNHTINKSYHNSIFREHKLHDTILEYINNLINGGGYEKIFL